MKRAPLIAVIDNYDSFTFNLVQYIGEQGAQPQVFRNDQVSVAKLRRLRPDGLLVSPGPGTPDDAGISVEAIRAFDGRIPILGVCLGHQCLATAYDGHIAQSAQILHGKTSEVFHAGRGIFEGLANPFVATRYHSLEIPRAGLPSGFEVLAWTRDDEIMAIRSRESETWGVQFHPESILTEGGKMLVGQWVQECRTREVRR